MNQSSQKTNDFCNSESKTSSGGVGFTPVIQNRRAHTLAQYNSAPNENYSIELISYAAPTIPGNNNCSLDSNMMKQDTKPISKIVLPVSPALDLEKRSAKDSMRNTSITTIKPIISIPGKLYESDKNLEISPNHAYIANNVRGMLRRASAVDYTTAGQAAIQFTAGTSGITSADGSSTNRLSKELLTNSTDTKNRFDNSPSFPTYTFPANNPILNIDTTPSYCPNQVCHCIVTSPNNDRPTICSSEQCYYSMLQNVYRKNNNQFAPKELLQSFKSSSLNETEIEHFSGTCSAKTYDTSSDASILANSIVENEEDDSLISSMLTSSLSNRPILLDGQQHTHDQAVSNYNENNISTKATTSPTVRNSCVVLLHHDEMSIIFPAHKTAVADTENRANNPATKAATSLAVFQHCPQYHTRNTTVASFDPTANTARCCIVNNAEVSLCESSPMLNEQSNGNNSCWPLRSIDKPTHFRIYDGDLTLPPTTTNTHFNTSDIVEERKLHQQQANLAHSEAVEAEAKADRIASSLKNRGIKKSDQEDSLSSYRSIVGEAAVDSIFPNADVHDWKDKCHSTSISHPNNNERRQTCDEKNDNAVVGQKTNLVEDCVERHSTQQVEESLLNKDTKNLCTEHNRRSAGDDIVQSKTLSKADRAVVESSDR